MSIKRIFIIEKTTWHTSKPQQIVDMPEKFNWIT